jgi:hypothetical protein
MTDADRLLRQIERQAQQKQAEAAARDHAQAVVALAALIQDVSAEAAAVLFLLHQQDFPRMVGATVQRPRLGLKSGMLGYSTDRVASWEISRHSRRADRRTGEILLLSNGKFMLSSAAEPGRELEVDDDALLPRLEVILDGLQRFRDELERTPALPAEGERRAAQRGRAARR